MRLYNLFGFSAGFLALLSIVSAAEDIDVTEPEIIAVAAFPEDNAFGHVVNGEQNKIFLTVENKSDRNVTLKSIAGAFYHPETHTLIKNTSALAYQIPLLEGAKMQLPYQFYSEFKPGDLQLNIWVEHEVEGERYRVTAYDSIVTIIEPEVSIFDFKLWSTYLVVTAILGGISYYAYLSFAPQPKRKTPAVSAPVTVTATGAGGYQEEWIPEHHLKKPKVTRKTKSGMATSGDETSGAELSTPEVKRKGKGRK